MADLDTDLTGLHQTRKVRILKLTVVFWFLLASCLIFLILDMIDLRIPIFNTNRNIAFDKIWEELAQILAVIFIFEIYLKRESERALSETLFSKEAIEKWLSLKLVRLVLEASIFRLLRDRGFAAQLSSMIENKKLIPDNRKYGSHYEINLYSLNYAIEPQLAGTFYGVTIRVRYSTHRLAKTLRYVVTSNHAQYHRVREDPTVEWCWLQTVPKDLEPYTDKFLKVNICEIRHINDRDFTVLSNFVDENGVESYVVPSSFHGEGDYEVRYELQLLSRKIGHYITINIDEPTKGLKVTLDYSSADLDHVNVLEALTTVGDPEVRYLPSGSTPESARGISVEVEKSWILPKSTVAFIWRTKKERSIAN